MANPSENTRGAAIMMLSMAAFSFGDACIKATAGNVPLSQILAMRGVLATGLIFLLAWRLDALRFRLSGRDWALIGLRSLAEVATAYFFLTALLNMPIANVTALLQMLPLTVTLGGALFFRDPVGWRRWAAIAVGFAGMLLIVKPGTEGFNSYVLYALIAVVCVTFRDLAVRKISRDVPSLTVTMAASCAVTGFAFVWSVEQVWVPLTPFLGGLIIASSLFIIGGYVFSVMVMRIGEVSFMAPFRYTGLLWALLLGWLVFGEWPLPSTLIGATIVVATGVFTLIRQPKSRARLPSV